MYIYVCMYIYLQMCVYTCVHTYVYACVHISKCTGTHRRFHFLSLFLQVANVNEIVNKIFYFYLRKLYILIMYIILMKYVYISE